MKYTKYLMLGAVLGLSACSITPEECDPTQEQSLLTKVQCQHSVFNAAGNGVSAADTRIERKEQQLLQSQEELRLAKQAHAQLKAQLAASNQSVAAEKAALGRINNTLSQLMSEVKKSKGNEAAKAAEIASIEAEMKALKNANSAIERQAIMNKISNRMSRSIKASGKVK